VIEDSGSTSILRQMLHSLAWIIGAVATVVIVQSFVARPFIIPSESMLPALKPGDRIMVGRTRAIWHTPERGQVAVFRPPLGATADQPKCGNQGGLYTKAICTKAWGGPSDKTYFVKRIVAVEGDRVSMRAGHLILNGKPANETYVHSPCDETTHCDFPKTVQVPKGQVLMLGDNRNNSDDGRFWGTIPTDWIVGPMIALWWPPNRTHFG